MVPGIPMDPRVNGTDGPRGGNVVLVGFGGLGFGVWGSWQSLFEAH